MFPSHQVGGVARKCGTKIAVSPRDFDGFGQGSSLDCTPGVSSIK